LDLSEQWNGVGERHRAQIIEYGENSDRLAEWRLIRSVAQQISGVLQTPSELDLGLGNESVLIAFDRGDDFAVPPSSFSSASSTTFDRA
jgi:hypothetical protein